MEESQKTIETLIKNTQKNQTELIESQQKLDKKIDQLNVEDLITKCKDSSLTACTENLANKLSSIQDLKKSQHNYFLTGIGIGGVAAIGILVLCCYLYKLHAKINALENLINQSALS